MHYIEGQKVWGRQEREGKLSGGWGGQCKRVRVHLVRFQDINF